MFVYDNIPSVGICEDYALDDSSCLFLLDWIYIFALIFLYIIALNH